MTTPTVWKILAARSLECVGSVTEMPFKSLQ
jgi:hypothetical protein